MRILRVDQASVRERDLGNHILRMLPFSEAAVCKAQAGYLIAVVARCETVYKMLRDFRAGQFKDEPGVAERIDRKNITDGDIACLPFLRHKIRAHTAAVIECGDDAEVLHLFHHEAGDPAAAGRRFVVRIDIPVFLNRRVDIAEHLAHALSDRLPCRMGNGQNCGIQIRLVFLGLIQSFFQLGPDDLRVGRLLDPHLSAFAVDDDAGGCIAHRIFIRLDIGDAVFRIAGDTLVRMAARDKTDKLGIHRGRDIHRILMRKHDRHIRLFLFADLADARVQRVKRRLDDIRRNARVHDASAIIGNIADDRDPTARLFRDDIVLCKIHALLRIGVVEVRCDDRRIGIGGIFAERIGRDRAVRIGAVVLDAPVKLVIAEGEGVVVHLIHRGAHRSAVEQIGRRRALIHIAAVEQQNVVVFPGCSCGIHALRNICKAILERSLVAA